MCEIVNETQLERLLLLLVGTDFNRGDISWGGAWAQYSLTCMLQDILAGDLHFFQYILNWNPFLKYWFLLIQKQFNIYANVITLNSRICKETTMLVLTLNVFIV